MQLSLKHRLAGEIGLVHGQTGSVTMTEITLVIGCKVHTTDNKISGYVKSVVVGSSTPATEPRFTVTHLVVEPKDREGLARLVPLDDHVDALADEIRLRYSEAEFKKLVAAEETLAEIFNSGPVELDTEGWRPADDDEPVVDGSKISPAGRKYREKWTSFLDASPARRRSTTAIPSMPPTATSGNSMRLASTLILTK